MPGLHPLHCATHGASDQGIDRAFEVLGFNQIMDIHDTLEEALESLAGPPEAAGGAAETANRPSGDAADRSRR